MKPGSSPRGGQTHTTLSHISRQVAPRLEGSAADPPCSAAAQRVSLGRNRTDLLPRAAAGAAAACAQPADPLHAVGPAALTCAVAAYGRHFIIAWWMPSVTITAGRHQAVRLDVATCSRGLRPGGIRLDAWAILIGRLRLAPRVVTHLYATPGIPLRPPQSPAEYWFDAQSAAAATWSTISGRSAGPDSWRCWQPG